MEIERIKPKEAPRGKKYALLIGVGEFKDSTLSPLAGVPIDIANFAEYNIPILPIEMEEVNVHAMFTAKYGHFHRLTFDHQEKEQSFQTIIDHIKSFRVSKEKIEVVFKEEGTR